MAALPHGVGKQFRVYLKLNSLMASNFSSYMSMSEKPGCAVSPEANFLLILFGV